MVPCFILTIIEIKFVYNTSAIMRLNGYPTCSRLLYLHTYICTGRPHHAQHLVKSREFHSAFTTTMMVKYTQAHLTF